MTVVKGDIIDHDVIKTDVIDNNIINPRPKPTPAPP